MYTYVNDSVTYFYTFTKYCQYIEKHKLFPFHILVSICKIMLVFLSLCVSITKVSSTVYIHMYYICKLLWYIGITFTLP